MIRCSKQTEREKSCHQLRGNRNPLESYGINPKFVKNQSQKCKQIEALKNLDPKSDFLSDPEKIPLEKCCSQLHGNLERMEFDPSFCQNSERVGRLL